MSLSPTNQDRSRVLSIIFRWIFIILSITIGIFLFKYSLRFWDMLPYMGSVVSIDKNDPSYIHSTTYTEFNRYASPEMKASMIEGHSFCKNLSISPYKFNEQLPFFKIKMLYVYFAWLFYKLGVPLFYAVLIPSILGFIGISLLSYQWINRHYQPLVAFLLSLVVLLLLVNFGAFRIASPDAMAGFFMIAGSYFFLEKKKNTGTIIMFSLAILTRPDNAIFVVILLVLTAIFNSRNNRRPLYECIGGVLIASLLFLLAKWQSGGYDAWRMFYRSFVYLQENPYSASLPFNMDQYLGGIKTGLRASIHNKGIFLLPVLAIAFFASYKMRPPHHMNIWIIAMITSLVVRIFLHPLFEARYLFGFIIVLILLVLARVSSLQASKK